MIDLKLFCDDSGSKYFMEPFSYRDYTYASDGAMIVRVPKFGEFKEDNPLNVSVEKLFDFTIKIDAKPIDLEDIELPHMVFCNDCEKEKRICDECKGTGYVEWDTDLHSYSADCKECHGIGSGECLKCGGKSDIDPEILIETEKFSSRRIYKIMQLPGEKKMMLFGTESPAYFTFNGGDGLIMPRRKNS